MGTVVLVITSDQQHSLTVSYPLHAPPMLRYLTVILNLEDFVQFIMAVFPTKYVKVVGQWLLRSSTL